MVPHASIREGCLLQVVRLQFCIISFLQRTFPMACDMEKGKVVGRREVG